MVIMFTWFYPEIVCGFEYKWRGHINISVCLVVDLIRFFWHPIHVEPAIDNGNIRRERGHPWNRLEKRLFLLFSETCGSYFWTFLTSLDNHNILSIAEENTTYAFAARQTREMPTKSDEKYRYLYANMFFMMHFL